MWTVIKFEKKQINFLREDLTKKLGSNYKIYIPKIKIQKYKKNKLISKEVSVLGDYMFCFHKQFNPCIGKASKGKQYPVVTILFLYSNGLAS